MVAPPRFATEQVEFYLSSFVTISRGHLGGSGSILAPGPGLVRHHVRRGEVVRSGETLGIASPICDAGPFGSQTI